MIKIDCWDIHVHDHSAGDHMQCTQFEDTWCSTQKLNIGVSENFFVES